MAFTATEKATMLFYLGRSVFEDDGPAIRAINGLDSKETTARPIIMPILTELQGIDTQLSKVRIRLQAVEDGSLKIDAAREIGQLRSLGRQAVGRLARWLKVNVPPDCDVFSASLPGDGFFSGDPSEPRFANDLGQPTGVGPRGGY
jgi:hypothetical protein